MSTYYAVLELSEQATPEEIRRAYRRLVLLTHPDRTPDPAAHEQYLAINAAYDVLSQPARRQLYDALLAVQRQPRVATPPPHRDPARRRSPATRVVRPTGPPVEPYTALYAKYVPKARLFCQMIVVLCSVLLLDYCWTVEYSREVIQHSERHTMSSRRSGYVTYYKYRTPHASFRSYDYDWPIGTHLRICRSALLGQVRELAVVGQPLQRADEASIYGNFFFVPVLLALLGVLGSWKGSSKAAILNYAAASVFVLALLIFFIYSA